MPNESDKMNEVKNALAPMEFEKEPVVDYLQKMKNEALSEDKNVPIILEWPFLSTGELKLCMNDEKMKFCMGGAHIYGGSSSKEMEEIKRVDDIHVGEGLWLKFWKYGFSHQKLP